MIYHNGMQSTKQNIVNMKRTGQQVEGCGILKLRLTERIFEKKSHKILEPMFDHGTTRIWSFTDVHSTAAVCQCAVLSSL